MMVLGLMSGTSLDGIDAALLEVLDPVEGRDPKADRIGTSGGTQAHPNWRLLEFRTRPYRHEERESLRATLASGGPRELALLNVQIGEWFALAALELLEKSGLAPESIAVIGSHGQTIWHEPPREDRRGASLQLGCASTIAERTCIPVVSDFRARDLAAGGHGAPLVPWADRIFFSSKEGPRALQNLGGMANVTWLPPAEDPSPLLAFDTGPGVALLDAAAVLATAGKQSMDEDGRLAAAGTVRERVLNELLAHPFFRQSPPRSTGREVFGPGMVEEAAEAVARDRGGGLQPGFPTDGWPDLLATLVALTARSMGDAYTRWVFPRGVDEVFLMGGGARNPVLVQAIRNELSPVPVRSGAALGMDPDAREAAAFGLLAWAHLEGVPANVPEATGATGPRVLGSLTPARGIRP